MQSTNDYRSRARMNNPYAQQDDNPSYSAPSVDQSTTNLTAGGDSMTAFYGEVRPPFWHALSHCEMLGGQLVARGLCADEARLPRRSRPSRTTSGRSTTTCSGSRTCIRAR